MVLSTLLGLCAATTHVQEPPVLPLTGATFASALTDHPLLFVLFYSAERIQVSVRVRARAWVRARARVRMSVRVRMGMRMRLRRVRVSVRVRCVLPTATCPTMLRRGDQGTHLLTNYSLAADELRQNHLLVKVKLAWLEVRWDDAERVAISRRFGTSPC